MNNRQTTRSPLGDEWFTPLHIVERVQEFYQGEEWLDAASCAEAQEYVKAPNFYTGENDALLLPWGWGEDEGKEKSCRAVWLNPPYSQPLISRFVDKAVLEYREERIHRALILTNASTETTWFQKLLSESAAVLLLNKRLNFWHPDKKSGRNPTGQVIFYLGAGDWNRFLDCFQGLGLFVSPTKGCANRHGHNN